MQACLLPCYCTSEAFLSNSAWRELLVVWAKKPQVITVCETCCMLLKTHTLRQKVMGSDESNVHNTSTVIALLFIWIVLALALFYFYKKLNADTNGQYTVQRMFFAPGGLRDRLRQGVGVVENRLGVRIWPQQRDDEENIGSHDEEDEEGEGQDKQNDSYTEEGEQQEHDDDGDDSSDDYSSVDLRERAKMQMEKKEEKDEAEEEKEERKEKAAAAREEDKSEGVKNPEKVELLVDLKPFTSSAIWSEENKDGNDLTAL